MTWRKKKNKEYMDILEEAADITSGSRHDDYGDALDNFSDIARVFNALNDNKYGIDHEDVVWFMVAVKISREQHKHKRDNLVDICGYLKLLSDILDNKPW